MAFWKGLGVGILGAIIVAAISSILMVGSGAEAGTSLAMLIMFAVFAAFDTGFAYYGAKEGFGIASQLFFFIFIGFMFMFSIVSISVGPQELRSNPTNVQIAITRTPLIATGLTLVIWYLMLGNGVCDSVWLAGAVPLGSAIVGFLLSLIFTAINPIASLIVAIVVGAGSIVAIILMRIFRGSLLDI